MTNNNKFVDFIEKSTTIAQKYGYTDVLAWVKQVFADGEIALADSQAYEKIYNIRNYMALGYGDDIQIPDKNLTLAEELYKAICQWETKKIAVQENQPTKEDAPEKPRTYIKKGDYVLMYSGICYGRDQNYRLRYDVFEVVEDLKLRPMHNYRFRNWSAAPISAWFPKGKENIAVVVLFGDKLPKDLGLGRDWLGDPTLWSSEECGKMNYIDGKWELYTPTFEYMWHGNRKQSRFKKWKFDGERAILACFDPTNPLAIEEQIDYIKEKYDGEYYADVAWKDNSWFRKHYRRIRISK